MTAEIGSQVYCDEAEAKRRDLVTLDLLGGSCAAKTKTTTTTTTPTRSTKELQLDLRIPHGWERRLDLMSGEIYLEKSNSDPVRDLNLPPPPPPAIDHQCTLEKVRSALERAGRESRSRRRSRDGSPSTSSSSSTSSTWSKRRAARDGSDSTTSSGSLLTAAGCSKCLTYVLISSSNPRCPRCDSHVPVVPSAMVVKKPRMEYI